MKKLLISLGLLAYILLLSSAPSALAAIAFDASSTGNGTGATISWQQTVTSSANTLLIVSFGYNQFNGSPTVTSIKYNGTTMNFATSTPTSSSGNNNVSGIWYLVNPTSGLNTTTITMSASGGINAAVQSSYTGVNQSTPIDFFNSKTNACCSSAVTVTTTASTDWGVDSFFIPSGGGSSGPAAGQTRIASSTSNTNYDEVSSYKSAPGTPSTTFTWNGTTGNTHLAGVTLNAAAAASGASNATQNTMASIAGIFQAGNATFKTGNATFKVQ